MGNFKRVMALVLAVVLSLGLMVSASAASSPTYAPDYSTTTKDGKIILISILQTKTPLWVNSAYDSTGKDIGGINQIGDGTNSIFSTKEGSTVTNMAVQSPSSVTYAANAFANANLTALTLFGKTHTFEKDCMTGIANKKVTIGIVGGKASDYTFNGKCLKVLSKKAKIYVQMSKKQFKKLVKKLKKAGFKGKIKRIAA